MGELFAYEKTFTTYNHCKYCESNLMREINENNPHGMSALNDGYKYQCADCSKLVR